MKQSKFPAIIAFLAFIFLYAPIVLMVIFSFNANRLVTVWSGFSTQYYVSLFQDQQIMAAISRSLQIAALSASCALILGTLCALALTRFHRFALRPFLSGMATAPLIMPDIVTGLSLLLLFVSMETIIGWPAGRGTLTIFIAHTTFSIAYIALIVRSRLVNLDPKLSEAAMDLGAKPWRIFWDITLPLTIPALIAGWLLAFTLSLDDLIIASFVSGPGSSTLPMVIFSKIRLGVSPEINALASLMMLTVTFGILIAGWIYLRGQKTNALNAN